MAVGRITGPLLKANLVRQGVNLAFETSLLYLDVNNLRVGVNTATPAYDLDVNGTTNTTNLTAGTATLASFTISGNTISSSNTTINLTPASGGVVYQGTLNVGSLSLNSNTVSSTGSNTNIQLSPSGTGQVVVNSNTLVNGNLHATGNITADGNITLGNANTDTVTFDGEVNSNIVPNTDITYNLGSASLRWKNIYTATASITTLNATTVNTTDFQTSGLDISGNTISSTQTNTNIVFNTSGTGGVQLGNFEFLNNQIINVVPNSISTFAESGSGYVKIAGTNGVVLPNGTDQQRPTAYETGMTRFNTTQQLVEVWNGTQWINIAGLLTGVTAAVGQDLGVQAALMLG